MPLRSWDEILSINHKAYYYFKYLHLPEGTCRLPAGEINGVGFQAGTLSLVKNKKDTDCPVLSTGENVSWSRKAEHIFQRRSLSHSASQITGPFPGQGCGRGQKGKKAIFAYGKRLMTEFTSRDAGVGINLLFFCVCFKVFFHGYRGRKMALATSISKPHMCGVRKHLVLMNNTAGKNIWFCFPIVISLSDFFSCPSLCVLVRIDKHPCVTK